ncbi:MAG: division/cell wall cluster transcriptional repressor MraZ [Pseudobdellovibrionaceae bacterium]|nr:division/cell wall cluster transcriptional repressor MraZ [Bdellovibrionales bacterium]USN46402.1 MAG: division/cell wall cluster transcriptional repressor MraZ [Pseudobdellovibrionaceae bacterium]
MFRGRFQQKSDSKGRVSLPPAYRQSFSEGQTSLVITNSQYQGKRCLDVYTLDQWEKLERRVAKMPALKTEVQAFQRFYLSGGQVINIDGNSRFLIPAALRKYADLGDELVLVGMGHKFEVWPQGVWDLLCDDLAGDFESILSSVAALEHGED